jgi:hypothetical protein
MTSSRILAASLAATAALALGACGSSSKTAATTATPTTTKAATTTRPATPTTKPGTPTIVPTTAAGGGGAQAGAPQWVTVEVTSPVPCQSGNATATMSYTTINVVTVAIKVGDGSFASTAGYNPNETHAVVDIPCKGAGSSTVQLRGCTEDGTCADSPVRDVTITG